MKGDKGRFGVAMGCALPGVVNDGAGDAGPSEIDTATVFLPVAVAGWFGAVPAAELDGWRAFRSGRRGSGHGFGVFPGFAYHSRLRRHAPMLRPAADDVQGTFARK